MLADDAIQFDLLPPSPPPQPPAWLRAFYDWLGEVLAPIGRLLRWIGSHMPDAPYARILLGILLVVVLLWLGRLLYLHLSPANHRRKIFAGEIEADEDALPEVAAARAWLQEADALAALGQYREAVHHLLIRSIEDIGRRRPQVLRPSLTSRDIAQAQGIPHGPRALFAHIATVVEQSLFGGQSVSADQWSSCRAAYSDFAERRISWR